MMNRRLAILLLVALSLATFLQMPGLATRLPQDTRKIVQELFPAGNLRLDGSVELPDRNLLLPLLPNSALKKPKIGGVQKFPARAAEPDLIVYENGWVHFRTERKGGKVTLRFPDDVPESVKKRVLSMKLPSDLIVPNGFILPKSMKTIVGDLSIPLAEDVALMKPQLGHKATAQAYAGAGSLAMVSIKDGTIILVDAKNYNKSAEFPTEGTPSSMTFLDGKIYIADQAKNRILLLDPSTKKFLGQIELPPSTAPKGIVAPPNGKWVYVSLSATSELAIIEAETGRLLMKTKVPTGPTRMAVTPDGVYVVLLSVTAAELSVISTYNQRLIGSVKVGNVPTGLVLHPTEKIAYVSNRMSNTISVIDVSKRSIINTIKTGVSPMGLAISPDGGKLYVAHGRDNTIIIYDTKTLQKLNEIKLPLDVDFPLSICLTPDAKSLIVSSQQTDTIGVLDTDTLEFTRQVQLGHTTQEIIWVPAS